MSTPAAAAYRRPHRDFGGACRSRDRAAGNRTRPERCGGPATASSHRWSGWQTARETSRARRIVGATGGGLHLRLTLQLAICILLIAMTLGEKVRTLRSVEGDLRGLGRPMTQEEIVRAIQRDTGS